MRKGFITILAVAMCVGALGVSPAGAEEFGEYAHHVKTESGQNVFGPLRSVHAAVTEPYGVGIGCAGIRGSGLMCPPNSLEDGIYNLGFNVKSEAYIHNHSTFTSYFNGLDFWF
jgi:hypothetical protein